MTPILTQITEMLAVSKDGRVISKSGWRGSEERELAQHPNSHGYLRIRACINGLRKSFLVHKLMAEHFLGPKPSKLHEVCHIDGNRQNNHVSNLRWGTRKENAADRTRHGNCKAAANGKLSAAKTAKTMKEIWKQKRSKKS